MSALPAERARSLPLVLGEAWAHDVANALRAQTRSVVGSWPGTLREARHRVLFGLPEMRRSKMNRDELDALAHAVYDAARRCWGDFSEPDLEP